MSGVSRHNTSAISCSSSSRWESGGSPLSCKKRVSSWNIWATIMTWRVLSERAMAAREDFPSATTHRAFIALIERRRAKLQEKALRVGRRVYEEPPAPFTARLGQYWRNWHHSEAAAPQRKNASYGRLK